MNLVFDVSIIRIFEFFLRQPVVHLHKSVDHVDDLVSDTKSSTLSNFTLSKLYYPIGL